MIFGASGLLGRPMMRAFADQQVSGTGLRRKSQRLITLDATSPGDVRDVLDRLRPDIVVNCVGERRPEVWAGAPARARRLNVAAARLIAQGAHDHGARLLHISSDYVFDGRNPAYRTDAPRNPVNAYGRWKRLAEDAVRSLCPEATILRLPVLYGRAEYATETNLTQIASQLSAGCDMELDDDCVRYPTHANEAAEVCRWIAGAQLQGRYLGSVCHWSAEQGFTKYEMVVMIARRFGLPAVHVRAGQADTAGGDRPVDCRLDCGDLRAALGWPAHRYRRFDEEFTQVVEPWLLSFRPVSAEGGR
ncbi:SDR family oxidoreductase [Spongiactinospora sp. TRM90649]|nr:SDR family oxidoreductase [Spongiactinospora sp. TRM90649]MDF5756749.1 SDR family oxidoreductase [Spongiactinospora sp. TRM90649]